MLTTLVLSVKIGFKTHSFWSQQVIASYMKYSYSFKTKIKLLEIYNRFIRLTISHPKSMTTIMIIKRRCDKSIKVNKLIVIK